MLTENGEASVGSNGFLDSAGSDLTLVFSVVFHRGILNPHIMLTSLFVSYDCVARESGNDPFKSYKMK